MVTGEDGRHGVHVTVHVTLKLELDNVTTRLVVTAEENLVLEHLLTLLHVRVVSCETVPYLGLFNLLTW